MSILTEEKLRAKLHEAERERDELAEAARLAAEQIRVSDYTPARNTLLVAISKTEGKG